ncbi:MAG TPA: hydrolase [Gammaproteobacteria bacterium]|nr:hydrolase [Gammaproteobacteria bacterium]
MITASAFRPAWWLPGAHLQTLYPSLFRKRIIPRLERQRLELPDGDFIDIDWTDAGSGLQVLVLHGLEGSLESHYAGALLARLAQEGCHAGLMYFRGRSGEVNRLPRSYHSGDTADLDYAIRALRTTHPQRKLAVIGFSLGGNVLLKWLGEQGCDAPVSTAIAISVPFDLDSAARQLERGLSRIYRNYLLGKLRQSVMAKSARHKPPLPMQELRGLNSFRAFDDAITAPLHGFAGVDDYYSRSSSGQFLRSICIPTLILQARDDPFLPADALPGESDLSPVVTLELAEHGGHVGFVSGRTPAAPVYWLEQRIAEHLAGYT